MAFILNSSFFWNVRQRRLVENRRLGTTYRSYLQGPSVHMWTWALGPWRWNRQVVTKRRFLTNWCCVTSRNKEEFGQTAAKACVLYIHFDGNSTSQTFRHAKTDRPCFPQKACFFTENGTKSTFYLSLLTSLDTTSLRQEVHYGKYGLAASLSGDVETKSDTGVGWYRAT
jgi:hypothetical protein